MSPHSLAVLACALALAAATPPAQAADLATDRPAGEIQVVATYEQNAVLRRLPDGSTETLVHDPRVLWPDTLPVAADGHLDFTANQLHVRPDTTGGQDLRQRPYMLFRTPTDAGPVRLAGRR